MLKRLELSTPTSCLNKASSDEPVFVLRAKDPFAAMTVRHWITMAEGTHETAKLEEAQKLADAMVAWRQQAFPAPPMAAKAP
jgi:hypothetical protein